MGLSEFPFYPHEKNNVFYNAFEIVWNNEQRVRGHFISSTEILINIKHIFYSFYQIMLCYNSVVQLFSELCIITNISRTQPLKM